MIEIMNLRNDIDPKAVAIICFFSIIMVIALSLITMGIMTLAIQDFEGYYLDSYDGKVNITACWNWGKDWRVGELSQNLELWEWIKENDLHIDKITRD